MKLSFCQLQTFRPWIPANSSHPPEYPSSFSHTPSQTHLHFNPLRKPHFYQTGETQQPAASLLRDLARLLNWANSPQHRDHANLETPIYEYSSLLFVESYKLEQSSRRSGRSQLLPVQSVIIFLIFIFFILLDI